MKEIQLNSYELSRRFFDWCFENPDLVCPDHVAIYFFAIEHCNRLGWKDKFGFPSQMTMEALGIKKHQTYIKYFRELIEYGFIKLIQESKNQYSANIISLQTAMPENGKALDKALIKHGAKQTESTGQSTGQSKVHIDKQETNNKEPINKEPDQVESYLLEFNKVRNTKFRSLTEKTTSVLKNTLKKYSLAEIIKAYENSLKAKNHIENNFQYLTPEFFTRIDKIEMYLNFGEVKPQGKQA